MDARNRPALIPQFGPLQGIRIISSGTIIAQPFAATLAAEMGAEVIHIERPGVGDTYRGLGPYLDKGKGTSTSSSWVQDARNRLGITLNLSSDKGREVFSDLLQLSDIWMESSMPGTYEEWEITDERVFAMNPRIVIVHVSGFGQYGAPGYLGRASYDMIGQAFSGLMHLTGMPNPSPPVRANPWTGDYVTALFCLWSALACYIYAQKTGRGQTIDLAQYEAIFHIQSGTAADYLTGGHLRERSGNKSSTFQPYDAFMAKDGWVVIGAVGPVVYGRVLKLLGLDTEDVRWKKAEKEIHSPEGLEFDRLLRNWVSVRTMSEVERDCNEYNIPSCPIYSMREIAVDPHYQARETLLEWEDPQVGKVRGSGIVPKLSLTPGQVWRGAPALGQDNELVLGRLLGYETKKIERLKAEGVI